MSTSDHVLAVGGLDQIADMETTVAVAAVPVRANAQIAFALCCANDADAVDDAVHASVVTPLLSQLECWEGKKATNAAALP